MARLRQSTWLLGREELQAANAGSGWASFASCSESERLYRECSRSTEFHSPPTESNRPLTGGFTVLGYEHPGPRPPCR
jgi:hypothetical protein